MQDAGYGRKMRSFNEFGFEKRSDTAENSIPLADDFITRRKSQAAAETREEVRETEQTKETKSVEPVSAEELSLSERQPEMTVMSVKGSRDRSITKPEKKRKNAFVTENVLEKRKKKFPLRTVMVVVFVFSLAFLLINQYVMITEYSRGIAEMKNTIEDLDRELDRCETDLIVKNKDIEIYAKENGMISDKDVKGEYIEISGNDVIEVYDTDEKGDEGIASVIMSALGENLINAWNTLTGAE